MPRDEGHEETEDILRKLENRIAEEYKQAEKEVSEKLNEYLRKFQKKDEIKKKAVENGLITQKEYEEWLTGQIMIGKRWQEMRDSLAEDFTNANAIAKSIAYGYMPDVYALNHNYGTYQVEHGALVDTSYTLYDRHTVQRLFDDNNTFYHGPGRKITDRINRGLDTAWNKKNVQSCMLQGILQGESIGKMAARLANSVGEQNRKAAIRNVRTMATGVQNAGRVDSYDRAKKMGIKVKKQWLAALDSRTRHWHRELDGVSVDNDKPFENEFGKIMYPGDPSADGANIYNCRCTLIADIEGFENDLSDLSLRNTNKLGDMSYEEWKNEHESTSDPITKQDDIAEAMKRQYGNEYNNLRNNILQSEESDIGRKAINTFRTLDTQVEDMKKGLKNANKEVREPLLEGINNTKYKRSKKKNSYYSPDEKTVYLKRGCSDGTAIHETIHAIDDRFGIIKGGAITSNISKDYNLILMNADSIGGVEKYFKSKYPEAFNDLGHMKEEYRGISDIIHGCTKGNVFMGYGHKAQGYWDREKALEQETLAQIGRIYYDNHKDVVKMLETEFSNTSNEFISILKEL